MRGQINDVNCFVSLIVKSHNLVNAVHFDFDDSTVLIATWTESIVGSATAWYLIMPNTSRYGCRYKASMIQYGVIIRWDGQEIF